MLRYFVMRNLKCSHIVKEHMHTMPQALNFDSADEIIINTLDRIMLIGINSSDKKNILTENGIDKMKECLTTFSNENKFIAAVLHGCGGNFCAGLEPSENALRKGEELLRLFHKLEKPIIGSLHGYTTNFGFLLAVMCDLRAMDETGLIGFGDKNERSNVPDEVYQRIVSTIGISKALELSIINCTLHANEAKAAGLVNKVVECGTALGQAITWAQSIALAPSDVVIRERFKIFSQIKLNK